MFVCLYFSLWPELEPNGAEAENCGSIKTFDAEKSLNDASCVLRLSWICEVKIK